MRKKSAAKRTSKKDSGSEAASEVNELPLNEESSNEKSGHQGDSKSREPKAGVRDARRETADEPIPGETAEKLVPSDDGKERSGDTKPRGRQKKSSESPSSDQDKQDGGDRRGRGRGRGGRDRHEKREPKPRTSVAIDSKDMAKKAWKIFQSEVTEEGLALLDDNGLRDYARSSFNAARLFLEEKERLVAREKQAKAEKKNRKQSDQEEKDD